MEGSGSLGRFLIDLAEGDEEGGLLDRYLKNPEREMEKAGLSTIHRDAILTGDIRAVREAVQQEYQGATVAIMICPPTVCPPHVWPHHSG